MGWKVLTQLLAELQPGLVTANLSRYVELRNSYQNRPNIGTAILWSVGQAGMRSLHSGIKGKDYSLFNFPMLYTFCCLIKFWIFNSISVIPMKFPEALLSKYFWAMCLFVS